MRKVGAVLAVIAVLAGALALGVALATAGPGGCATALLQGRLVEVDGTLAVEAVAGGQVTRVEWPFGYGVRDEGGTLTLTRVFMTVAREGDQVSVGGGEGGPGFRACGPVTIGLVTPPDGRLPGVALRVTGSALEPCIPPPSGCGYWVRLSSASSGSARAPLEHDRSFESAASGQRVALRLGDGLPAGLAPGVYDLTFEAGVYDDSATEEPLDDGTMGYRPVVSTACVARLVVPPDAAEVGVDVTYRGSRCEVAIE